MVGLWLAITKNQIRLWTNRFRNHRRLLFVLIFIIMGIYSFVLIPLVFYALAGPISSFFLGFGPGLAYFMYFIFSIVVLFIFIYCITIPFTTMLQTTDDLSGQLEILLASPVKARDILFGKFIGNIPAYLIILFAIAPWIVNLFSIVLPLPFYAHLLIYLVLFTVVILGMWLGILLSSYIETKVRKSERSRDLGRAIMFLITFIVALFMYLTMWIMFTGLSDPSSPLYQILMVFPSTWSTFIIMELYGLAAFLPLNVGIFVLLLTSLTLVVLYFGYRGAGRFYSLEPVETGTERIATENKFYQFFRFIIPGNFGIQILTQLKQYSRKMENFSRIGYGIGLSAMMIIFQLILNPYHADVEYLIVFTTFMYAWIVSMMLGCYVIVGSKDSLWIYRKGPNGVSKFVKSVYIVNLIYTIPIGMIYSIIVALAQGISILEGLLMIFFSVAFLLSLMAGAIGLAFIFPTFEERGGKLGIIMLSAMGYAMGSFIGGIIMTELLHGTIPFAWPLFSLIFTSSIGYILLRLGIRKLSTLE